MVGGTGKPDQWWRWGDRHRSFPPARAERVRRYLSERLQTGTSLAPPPVAQGPIPPSILRESRLKGLPGFSVDPEDRLRHSVGRSYYDLLAARRGSVEHLTEAVVTPRTNEEVETVLRTAEAEDLAVIPWGGGTSVVGGVTPLKGEHRAAVTLSLERMSAPLWVDASSRLARFECGILGPALETHLAGHGLTLGHYPQSFEFSTLGGWIASRSSGQSSSLYGDLAHNVRGLKVVTPLGAMDWEHPVEEATGPTLESLLVGSEGTFGVITEATLSLAAVPSHSVYHGFLLKDWESGCEFLRDVARLPYPPAVIRLSDPEETALSLVGREPPSALRGTLEKKVMDFRGIAPGKACLGFLGFEGPRDLVEGGWRAAGAILRSYRGLDAGEGAGEAWKKERFLLPYLRDYLMEYGFMTETLETGCSWKNLGPLYRALTQKLERAASSLGTKAFVGTHLSHALPTGACLYVTLLAPQPPNEFLEPLQSLKRAAMEAITENHGSLSHHHGIGTLHRPWARQRDSPAVLDTLSAVKRTVDPKGIMNPGKTLPQKEDRR